ncbi:RHS repeat-associated core domain-containing protein [Chitinophaga sp. W2I13]|uniref:RHS repeat-associated core domain-containing protein n=1 Tax=Chitinophaga sp. W2I13 TaxID=3373923 RepID=UPI003D19E74B
MPLGSSWRVRKWALGGVYRYGFNGKENDNEVKGEGNQIDYGMRIYDPRIGKFLSTDPLTKQYPHYTPYQFAGNTPIQAIDLDGAEEYHFTYIKGKDGNTSLHYLGKTDVIDKVVASYRSSHSTYNDAPVPVYETRVNQRQLFTVHDVYREPIDRHGGLDPNQSQEWRDFDIGTTYNSLDDFSRSKNGSRSFSDRLAITATQFGPAMGPENAALPAGGLGGGGKLSDIERKIVAQSRQIVNAKEFNVIRKAFEKGVEVEVNIKGTKVLYNPEWTYSEAMTLENEGFMLGPKAFNTASGGVEHTVIWETSRLYNQTSKSLGVGEGRGYTDFAQKTADKLLPYVKKK